MEQGPETMPRGKGPANAIVRQCPVERPDRLFPDGGPSGGDGVGAPGYWAETGKQGHAGRLGVEAAVFGRSSIFQGAEHGPGVEGVGGSHERGVICEDYDAIGEVVSESMLIISVIGSGVVSRAGRLGRPGELDDSNIVWVPWVGRGKAIEEGAARRVVYNQGGSPAQRVSDGPK